MSESKHTETDTRTTEFGEIYDKRTIESTAVCVPCGNIFVQEEDYDSFGSEGGVCCPDCGTEKFVSVKLILDQRDALLEACKRLLGAMRCDELNNGQVFNDDLRKEVKEFGEQTIAEAESPIDEKSNQGSEPARQGVGPADSDKE